MPDTIVSGQPFFLSRPWVHLGATGAGTEISCSGTHLTAEPSQDDETLETFCGAYTNYKKAKWTITFTVALSYGTSGSWTLIHPLCGTIVPFEIRPDQAAASVSNPSMSGTAVVKQLSFIDADPGTASEVDLELAVQGDPVFGITSPTQAMAETEAPVEAPAA